LTTNYFIRFGFYWMTLNYGENPVLSLLADC